MTDKNVLAGRGRIEISGFDPKRVEQRESLSGWTEEAGRATQSRWARAWQRFKRNRSALLGLAVVGFLTFLAIFARPIEVFGLTVQPIALAPHPPGELLYFAHPGEGFTGDYQPPSMKAPMGLDGDGRDIFSRLLYGGRYSLSIGFIVVALTAGVGLIYGAVSGYYGGWVDEIMMRIVDIIYAFPGLVLALIIVSMLGRGYTQLIIAFSLFGWAGYGRLVRGEVLKVKEHEYVMAAKALGARDRGVVLRHIAPNTMAPLLVVASLRIGTVVIGVAALGFLGLGMPPGSAEWGTMLNGARSSLIQLDTSPKWWATVFPGTAIFLFVMSMNMIGDGINDALDAQQTGVGKGGEE
ncbi:ABC transporter permease [Halovivax cerinus]|uniref:ABC transporter permease n=1 Tax=Halovivax cerinus TaxID=1487865 RepID=A0ABD5NJT5_9EURY|nr:ABC transporter permease [Halovivax cerinus]